MDPKVKKILDDSNKIIEIIRGSTRVKLHDWTGEELAIYIEMPKLGDEKVQQAAADYLAAAIQRNLYSITLDAIMKVQDTTMERITIRSPYEILAEAEKEAG